MRKVSGRMRSPWPAARTIAVFALVMGVFRLQSASGGKSARVRQLARVQVAQLRERRMRKVALEIAGDPRDVSEITALAVTFRQSRKNAEDLRVALGAERCVERAN